MLLLFNLRESRLGGQLGNGSPSHTAITQSAKRPAKKADQPAGRLAGRPSQPAGAGHPAGRPERKPHGKYVQLTLNMSGNQVK